MPKKRKRDKKKERHKDKKRKNKKKYRSSSDDSESCTSDSSEWVEKKVQMETQTPEKSLNQDDKILRSKESLETNDWMSETLLSRTYSKDTKNDQKRSIKKDECIVAEPGQSNRELNPYWKNGGTGLPEQENNSSDSDEDTYQDAEWLKKALRRSKERAKSENIPLENVVAERYGSLDNLYRLIDRAEARRKMKKSHYRDGSSHVRRNFMKPADDDQMIYDSFEYQNKVKQGGTQSWRKYKNSEKLEIKVDEKIDHKIDSRTISSSSSLLTDSEMNTLASKILKAEIMGNISLVNELTEKLRNARNARQEVEKNEKKDQVVLLTTTNDRGFSQPVRGLSEKTEKKKSKTYETHIAGERVRYFEDDEKYSLNEMYVREMAQTSSDQNADFLRLTTKTKKDKDFAVDDLFMEQTTSNKNVKDREIADKISRQKKVEKALDNCTWCLVNNKLQKHLIISSGAKCYLAVPFFQSLTEGHCLITATYHSTCSTLVDEDVWEEILKYCKHLVGIFKEQNKDVVFFETAFNFRKYPHMLIHCVPIPYESGELAPIYFKKAIMECEKEWAQNKQIVNVKKFDVRRVIPTGLPYFMVHFGVDNGFAHVIEDESRFPKNFAQEVIGGILDLDHQIWRKQHADDFETQCKKVNEFKSYWKKIE